MADILTNTLGRKITHVKLSKEEFASTLVAKVGIPPQLAGVLAYLDVEVSKGTEENMSDEVERVTGKRPKAMKEFIEANRSSWMKD